MTQITNIDYHRIRIAKEYHDLHNIQSMLANGHDCKCKICEEMNHWDRVTRLEQEDEVKRRA